MDPRTTLPLHTTWLLLA